MFETLRVPHEEKVQKLRAYDKAELPIRRDEEAYKRFSRKPYYLEKGAIKRGNQQDGCADNDKAQ